MKSDNPLKDKSYTFALRIIKLSQFLVTEKKEYILSKQILRSGSSIGANIEEAIGAQSDKDFYAKLCISYKEARESHYWLRLLRDSGYLSESQSSSLIQDCDELLKLNGTILKTLKAKLHGAS